MASSDPPARQTDRVTAFGGGGADTEDGAAGGHAATCIPTAVSVRPRPGMLRPTPHGPLTSLQLMLAPLCVAATAAAFVAEVRTGGEVAALSAVAVVPVLAASMLRPRWLTVLVAGFAVLLQVGGVATGVVDRDTAGMQISVYLLTLAVAVLQQSRSPLAAADAEAPPLPEIEVASHPTVIKVAEMLPAPVVDVQELPLLLAQLLTKRERDVVLLAAHGCTARQIGQRLFIGERTVETHLANAYGKLGVRTKAELIRLVTAVGSGEIRTGTEASQQVSA